MELTNKTVVITGASSGIGQSLAMDFAGAGANLVLVARREEKLQEVADALPDDVSVLVVPGDVTNEDDVRNVIDRTLEKFGTLDVMVNNAGYGMFKPIHEMSAEEFDGMIAVNLRGVFLGTKYALAHMYEQGTGGAIVTISSLAGKNGFAGGGGYCASKFGVMGLMESAFHEARSHNVRVINIAPGSVDTPFFDEIDGAPANPEKVLRPEDVAATVVYALELPDRALIRELDIRPANPR